MFLDGIAIAGYRSFGKEIQRIGPLAKINLFIGQNNSGKSNILLFLYNHLLTSRNAINKHARESFKLIDIDYHINNINKEIKIGFGLYLDGELYSKLKDDSQIGKERYSFFDEFFDKILCDKAFTNNTRVAWFDYISNNINSNFEIDSRIINDLIKNNYNNPNHIHAVWRILTNNPGGGGQLNSHWVPQLIPLLTPVRFNLPKVEMIPAIRKVGEQGTNPDDFSGLGLIDRLARLQNPSINEINNKEKFQNITKFLREVTTNENANIEIPYGRNTIHVEMDGKILPLSSLGTGIHEVIILATAATVLEDQILCIEEPELHLHPLLQKQLIKYMRENTSNQYFITTHSAHLLDIEDVAVFHVKLVNNNSIVESSITPNQKFEICSELGYRASDILQSNAIIWVEGPSDRIYINHWLKKLNPDLNEGLHYSIMFYGGKLLSHLTANDPEIDEFISLRRLNRNTVIVIDSDKTSSHSKINESKKRIKDEFNGSPGFAWITKGKEIENYLDPALVESAIRKVHPHAYKFFKKDKYSNILNYQTNGSRKEKTADKVKIAKQMTSYDVNLDILDLKQQLFKLNKFILTANGLT